MSFSSPDAGFPPPYGDGYGMHMVCFLYNWTFNFDFCNY